MRAGFFHVIILIFLDFAQLASCSGRREQTDYFIEQKIVCDSSGRPIIIDFYASQVSMIVQDGLIFHLDKDTSLAQVKVGIVYDDNVDHQLHCVLSADENNNIFKTNQLRSKETGYQFCTTCKPNEKLYLNDFSSCRCGAAFCTHNRSEDVFLCTCLPKDAKNYIVYNMTFLLPEAEKNETKKSESPSIDETSNIKPVFTFDKQDFSYAPPLIPPIVYAPQPSMWANSASRTSGLTFYAGPDRHPSAPEMSDCQREKYIYGLIARTLYCHIRYGMTPEQVSYLMSRWFSNFVQDLLSKPMISEEALWELWLQYKEKRFWNWQDSKDYYENIIKAELTKRLNAKKVLAQHKLEQLIKSEMLKAQDQIDAQQKKEAEAAKAARQRKVEKLMQQHDAKKVTKEYQRCMQICDEHKQLNNLEIWQSRSDALQKTIDQDYKKSWQEIELSAQVQGYLRACDLNPHDYKYCYGTPLQQQLHTEICSSFQTIATAQRNFSHKILFLDIARQCSEASFWSNDCEAVHLAMGLQDLAQVCCDTAKWIEIQIPVYLQAMSEGVTESACEFIYMAHHPREIIKNIAQAVWFVCDTIALVDEESIGSTLPFADQQRQERSELIHAIALLAKQTVINADGPERAKMIAKFTSDCVFQHKALQAVGTVAGIIKMQPSVIKATQLATDLMSFEPAFAGAAEHAFQAAAQDLEIAIQKSLTQEVAEISKSLEVSSISTIATRPLAEIISEITTNFGGKIPLSNPTLCEEVEAAIKKLIKKANIVIDEKFKKASSWKMIEEGGTRKKVNLDIEHIINYGVEFVQNEAEGFMTITFKGGHLAGSTEALAAKGLIRIVDMKMLPNGCMEYSFQDFLANSPNDCIKRDFCDLSINKHFTKTEFPAHWDYKKLVQSCWEVYEKPLISDYIEQAPKVIREGMTSDSFKMSLIMKNPKQKLNMPLAQSTINIITALPLTKKI